MIEKLLKTFKEEGVAVQITLDLDKNPTVHAFSIYEGMENMRKTEHETLLGALMLMKEMMID